MIEFFLNVDSVLLDFRDAKIIKIPYYSEGGGVNIAIDVFFRHICYLWREDHKYVPAFSFLDTKTIQI